MAEAPFISVLVPVYNCRELLHRCVESVLGQSFSDLELILVDDGSTDGSEALCDSYAQLDERVRVIHQANAGTSAARNAGMAAARGTYLMFLDNDDRWVRDSSLEHVARRLRQTEPDVLLFLSEQHWVNTGAIERRSHEVGPTLDNPTYPLVEGDMEATLRTVVREYLYSAAVWRKAIRRDLVRSARIGFPEGRRNEDAAFSFDLLRHLTSLDFLNEYVYVWHRGMGVTQSSGVPSRTAVLDLADMLRRCAAEAAVTPSPRKETLEAYLATFYAVWMGYAYLYEDPQVKEARTTLRAYAHLLGASERKDVRAIRVCARILGQALTGRLLALRYHVLARMGH